MKSARRLSISLVTGFFFLSFVPLVIAQNIFSTNNIPVKSKDYINASESVVLSDTIQGDAYITGGNVFIDGTITGDLLVAGGTVTINGRVAEDLRVAGGSITINGNIEKNVTVAGGTVFIGPNATISGSLIGFFGNLNHQGKILGNTRLWGNTAHINGQIGADLEANVDQLYLEDKAIITGNLSYTSPHQSIASQLASVSGEIAYNAISSARPSRPQFNELTQSLKGFKRILDTMNFISSLIIGYIILRLFPLRMIRKTEIITSQFGKALIVGFATIVIIPFVSVGLLFTFVGIPIALLLFALFGIIVYTAKIWVAFGVGRIILTRIGAGERRGWALVAGLLLYYFVGYIPFIGWFIKLAVTISGIGVLIMEKKEYYQTLVAKKIA